MRLSRLFVMSLFVGAALTACGDDGGTSTPDAPIVVIDAAPDAPAALTGVGQKCGTGLPACPANASQCVGFQGTTQWCTPLCLENGSGTTNAQGQLTATTPAPNNGACTGAFTGTAGMAVCGVILAITPMDNPLVANKAYTGISLACVVACGASNACPTGMTCNTTQMICLPN